MRLLRSVRLEAPVRSRLAQHRASQAARRKVSDESRRWAEVKHEVQAVVAHDGPIVIGPWLSEVGFELLYWVPFLRWLCPRFGIAPDRLYVVSRGGAQSWYAGIADHYVDVFDFMEPDAFRAHTEARWTDVGGQKQMEMNRWDREILDAAGDRLPWNRHAVLHPSLMYRLFQSYWKDAAPMRHITRHTTVAPLSPPAGGDWEARLPDEPFVAVKFYFRPSFPDLPINRAMVAEVVGNLAAHQHVVLLNTGLNVDDHSDIDPGVEGNITWLLDGVPANLNLHVQSLAISRARAFVGTYGGLSYLAPFYGVPSLAFYSEAEHFLPAHLDFARRIATSSGSSIAAVSTRNRAMLDLLGRVPGTVPTR